ncbi:MAG: anhydro-N-acetylmuramic acid kinase [Anaerolineae bacterium]|nr:anhydro-N-acetylmuramic acid kinase [Anaerolineae bacterium]
MRIIGLMSGTSADGIDAALCEIEGAPPQITARIIKALTFPYPEGFQQWIFDCCEPNLTGVDEICRLNVELGNLFAQAAQHTIEAAELTAAEIDLIGSHGQTIWHHVEENGHVHSTMQISEAAVIAEQTGVTTVSNFRPRDIAAGGQGAPLTAYADWLLLRHPDHWRAVQNIGGIANVTFLPPLSDTESTPIAFDTGPGNILIDAAINYMTGGEQPYDVDGSIASAGTVDEQWVRGRLFHPYFRRKPPKTTGREVFNQKMAVNLVDQGRRRKMSDHDIIAGMTAVTARSISAAYERFAPAPIGEVVIGGGGARNRTLMRMLREDLAPTPVLTHEEVGIDSDFKEALAFALLAHETWHHRPGTLAALTGAQHESVLGQITPGSNYAALIRKTWCG